MSERRRVLPSRTKSAVSERPTSRRLPTRCKSSDGGGDLRNAVEKIRRRKKGIRVNITVRKREQEEQEDVEQDAADTTTTSTEKNQNNNNNNNNDMSKIYQMEVTCSGKHSAKGNWADVNGFWQASDKTIDKDTMCDLLEQYSQDQYPDRRGADNLRPKTCYLRDEPLRGISYYKDFGWDPVKLEVRGAGEKSSKAASTANVEILEQWTKQVTLEQIPVDFSTDLETVLIDQGDKSVVSTLIKSPLQGHPLAKSMLTSDTQIVVELRGLESVVGVLGNDERPDDTEEDQRHIWRDVKTLRALLHDQPMPPKEGKGTQRTVEVVALESYVQARVHYTAAFEGDVVSDHGVGLLLGERWWAHPLKDIMMGFQVDNAAKIHEDIELRFFSEIGYKMENEYFDWENHGGKWVKVKKQRVP